MQADRVQATDCRTIRSWDRIATERYGLPGICLMENAGAAVARALADLARSPASPIGPPFHIVCGPGNNGGDGFVVARHLQNFALEPRVLVIGGRGYESGTDARLQYDVVRRMSEDGLNVVETAAAPGVDARIPDTGTIVDGLFGTGLSRPIESPFLDWIVGLGQTALPVAALDLPSGLDGDTGQVRRIALRADHTFTFAAPKTGFSLARGPELCGLVSIVDIGLPARG